MRKSKVANILIKKPSDDPYELLIATPDNANSVCEYVPLDNNFPGMYHSCIIINMYSDVYIYVYLLSIMHERYRE